ncbi:MAG: hypothetical protein CV087_07580 [Candidatus Brocadia sp. WS118]|nr:MAG: hypothetical protein CV087_07580 [Candidatus Brocadia sp. WS118]
MKYPEMRFVWRFVAETSDGNIKLMPDSGNYGNLMSKLDDVGIKLSISSVYRLKPGYNREYVCDSPELSNFAVKILGQSRIFEWRIQVGKAIN